jgi:hypothetical protein
MVTKTTNGKFRASYLVDGNFVDAGVFDTVVEAETEADRKRLNVYKKAITNLPGVVTLDVFEIYSASLRNFKKRLDNMPVIYQSDISIEEIKKFKQLLDKYYYKIGAI